MSTTRFSLMRLHKACDTTLQTIGGPIRVCDALHCSKIMMLFLGYSFKL